MATKKAAVPKDPKKQRFAKFVYNGLGFPIELRNVELVRVRDIWTPNINLNELSKKAYEALALRPGRMTAAEVRFVRHYNRLDVVSFAAKIQVSAEKVLAMESLKRRPGNAHRTGLGLLESLMVRSFVISTIRSAHPKAIMVYENGYVSYRKPDRKTR